MTHRPRFRSAFPGFSLIEVIIVIVLIGIVSIFAVPKLVNNYSKTKVRAAARIIMTDIRYAQSYAMTTHDSAWVQFDDNLNQYRLYAGPARSNWYLVNDHIQDGSAFRQLDAGDLSGVSISTLNIGSAKTIGFDSFGNTVNSGTIELNGQVTITLIKYTGLVVME